MKILILSILVLAAFARKDYKAQFAQFQQKYSRVYASAAEADSRYQIFVENMKEAEVLQRKNPRATFGVTKFSDLSKAEFAKFYLNPTVKNMNMATIPVKNFTNVKPIVWKGATPDPTNYDWFTQGVCTPVYDQGQCGSCWAFSATETIESYWALGGKTLTSFSVEQIVDCDTAGQDQGCNGGFPSGAYTYVQSAGGIEDESVYPYTAGNGQSGSCQFNAADVDGQVASYASINGETGLYQQASTAGPVSVCVDASSWSSYTGGVLTSCGNNVDHCVQLTGYANYGSSNAYWIVRNSWNTDWGLNGFIWIQIGQDLCSIGDYATVVSP